jgi:hypothetical protein
MTAPSVFLKLITMNTTMALIRLTRVEGSPMFSVAHNRQQESKALCRFGLLLDNEGYGETMWINWQVVQKDLMV